MSVFPCRCVSCTVMLGTVSTKHNSSFVLSLHPPFAFCFGPNILLNIFLSNTNNFCLMFSVKTQHSDPYTTTGLIRALYNFILVFLDISLFWSIFWSAKEARLPAAILSFISSSVRLSLVTVVPRYTHTHTHTCIYIYACRCPLECGTHAQKLQT